MFFERAIALDPGYARAHMSSASTLDLKGDFLSMMELSERGSAAIERALALRPDHAEVWRYLRRHLHSLGRDARRWRPSRCALEIDPTDASAHNGVARMHFILRGDFARAVPAYERALALNPRAGWSALQLAHCATLLGDFPRPRRRRAGRSELQQAFLSGRAGMVIVGAHMRLGHASALQGRHAEALAEFEREAEFVRTGGPRAARADLHRAAAADRRGAAAARRAGLGGARSTWRSRPTSGGCAAPSTTP